jgi:serine/threonine protein phosphatase PrpC
VIDVLFVTGCALTAAVLLLAWGGPACGRLQTYARSRWFRGTTTTSRDRAQTTAAMSSARATRAPDLYSFSDVAASPVPVGGPDSRVRIDLDERSRAASYLFVARTPGRSGRRAWLWSETTGREHLLLTEHVTLGRSGDNDIVIDDPTVSRQHAALRFEDGSWWLLPEVASNGTFVNGDVVPPGEIARLGSGDRLRLGTDVELLLVAPVRDVLSFDSVGRTTPGSRRRINEDAMLATADTLVVADGVGGLPAGEIASRVAVHTVAVTPADVPLDLLVRKAHAEVWRQAGTTPMRAGMATTLDVVRLIDSDGWTLTGAHVGDGLAILQRGNETTLLTVPDRVGARLEARDPERAAAVRNDPDYNLLTAGLGFPTPPTPQLWTVPAEPGQRLVLASDGLLAVLPQDELIALLRRYQADPPARVADLLLELAMDGPDNVTVVVADVASGKHRGRDGRLARPSVTDPPAISAAEFRHTDADTTGRDR